jgi:hypothetical protein
MPRGDGKGPMGMGPRSGRAAGYCARFDMPGYENRDLGQSFGWGSGQPCALSVGGGHGWRHMFWATGLPGLMRSGKYHGSHPNIDPSFEKQALKNQAEALQSRLELVKKRLSEIDLPNPDA